MSRARAPHWRECAVDSDVPQSAEPIKANRDKAKKTVEPYSHRSELISSLDLQMSFE